MKNILTLAISLFLASCVQYSEEYKDNVSTSFDFILNDNLNKLTIEHVICYICETKSYPNSVRSLNIYKPTTSQCAAIFTGEKFEFFNPNFENFKITHTEVAGRLSLVFSESGVSFSELREYKGNSMVMNIDKEKVNCTYNKRS